MRSLSLIFVLSAVAVGATLLPVSSARADVVNIWTTYSTMSDCKSGLVSVAGVGLVENDYCFGLEDGQAIGLIDAGLTLDELDQSLGMPYDDETSLPAPEGPDNPVVEVWNNTADDFFIAAGNYPLQYDINSDLYIFDVPAGEDLSGPSIDMISANHLYEREIGGDNIWNDSAGTWYQKEARYY
jgi:hypothetical protein